MSKKVVKTDEEWQESLSPEVYEIARKGGTERAFTGAYHDLKTAGLYRCACCGSELFSSETKYDSGSGWPSFYSPIDKNLVTEKSDNSHNMVRTEILCSTCDGHLGHVFSDGPEPTGLRYCINSASLKFEESE